MLLETPNPPQLLTAHQAAAIAQVHVRTVQKWV
jgi:hypothetical protein